MPDRRRKNCRWCRRHEDEVGPISWGGCCPDCARARMMENIDSNIAREGPFYVLRQYRMAQAEYGPRVALALKQAGVFGTVLDDMEGVA